MKRILKVSLVVFLLAISVLVISSNSPKLYADEKPPVINGLLQTNS